MKLLCFLIKGIISIVSDLFGPIPAVRAKIYLLVGFVGYLFAADKAYFLVVVLVHLDKRAFFMGAGPRSDAAGAAARYIAAADGNDLPPPVTVPLFSSVPLRRMAPATLNVFPSGTIRVAPSGTVSIFPASMTRVPAMAFP